MAGQAVAVRRASPDDLGDLGLVDTSYRTDRIYRVRRSELGFWLDEERVGPPVHKTNPRPQLELGNGLFVACVGTELVGYAELLFDAGMAGPGSSTFTCQASFGVVAWGVP
jgi:hypothetical protein